VGTEETYCIGPWGKAPDWIEAKTVNDQWNILNQLIDILTNEEHVHQSDIIVLTPLGMGSTMFKNQSSVGSFNFVPYEKRNDYTINWSTIRRFKGLESPVVILLEFEESFKNHPRMEELLYVGMSRAKSSLFIISPEKYTEQS
jgi:superfamily I DNA and RNA helicase